jgi:hypothetical protein
MEGRKKMKIVLMAMKIGKGVMKMMQKSKKDKDGDVNSAEAAKYN